MRLDDPDLSGKLHNLLDLHVSLFLQLVAEIFPDGLRRGIIKTKMIVEPTRPVHDIAVETVQLVAGHDEQLLAAGRAVEEAEQSSFSKTALTAAKYSSSVLQSFVASRSFSAVSVLSMSTAKHIIVTLVAVDNSAFLIESTSAFSI